MKISRRDQREARVDDQVDARVHHRVELAHVVGGARHHVADPLAVVERLALAEQAQIQLVAGVALQSLCDELTAEDGGWTKQEEPADEAEDDQRERE